MGEQDEQIINALKAHNYTRTNFPAPQNNLEWSLNTCDELTGLIVACALVRPEKKPELVTTQSVLKKFPQKSFAAGVVREDIMLCDEKLGIKLEDFVGIVLESMKRISIDIGL